MRCTRQLTTTRAITRTAIIGVVALAGCGLQQPTPLVTVVSGAKSVHTEASRFCFEDQDPAAPVGSPEACGSEEVKDVVLKVKPGRAVGVDVAKEVTEAGWYVAVRAVGQEEFNFSGIQRDHYFTFAPQFAESRPIELEIRSVAEGQQQQSPATGVWRFTLVPD